MQNYGAYETSINTTYDVIEVREINGELFNVNSSSDVYLQYQGCTHFINPYQCLFARLCDQFDEDLTQDHLLYASHHFMPLVPSALYPRQALAQPCKMVEKVGLIVSCSGVLPLSPSKLR